MQSKKILFISAFPPCQKTAGQDYTRRLINDLVEKKYDVSIIYAEYSGHEIELPAKVKVIDVIKPSLKNCCTKIMFHPFFTKRFDKKILNKINSISKDFDMLYFDFSQVHLYAKYIKHPFKVLMCHDVICQKFSRKGLWQLPFIKKSEGELLKYANWIITFSDKDSEVIKNTYKLASKPVNFYLKNGHYQYKEITLYKNTFCFYGAWNREENIECLDWFLKNIYAYINSAVEFLVIGGGMSSDFQNKLNSFKNIKYLGFVGDPIFEISKCQALIAPLRKGAGVKVKVIDALSSGTPVIGSSVAFEGILDNPNCKLFNQFETPEEYIQAINNWINIKVDFKQQAADEFFTRYDVNHFTDLLK